MLDIRSGHTNQFKLNGREIWSASRLNKWIQCPRKGWLESELYLSKDETMNGDLDVRIRGKTLHDSFAELICFQLGFKVEKKATSQLKILQITLQFRNINVGIYSNIITKAHWIWRSDIYQCIEESFIGMTLSKFNEWIGNKMPPIKQRKNRTIIAF